ncbi:MAG: bifunctional oligoribonuclease/PAP phosphatase NrnA [Bacilli bacterium]|nr:bifunctional oligoribonuclease/PAP phosphatase NrnA [Bacilli bacterium]
MEKKYHDIYKKISEYGTIIIHRHARPDGDAIGSQIGLREAIKQTFPYKKILMTGDMTDRFAFMGKMDDVKDSDYNQALVFILDSGDEFLISDDRYKNGKYIIRIDHHVPKNLFAHIELINPNEISCSLMIAKMIFATRMRLNSLGAKALFLGLVTDSGRFRYDGLDKETFEIAGKLINYGFDYLDLYNNIYTEELEFVKLRANLTTKFKTTEKGVAYLINTQEEVKQYNVDMFTISRGMVSIMSGIKGIDIWANFTEDVDGKIIVELRCNNKYNVNGIALKYGGGGHKQASGCTLSCNDDIKNVLADLDKLL